MSMIQASSLSRANLLHAGEKRKVPTEHRALPDRPLRNLQVVFRQSRTACLDRRQR